MTTLPTRNTGSSPATADEIRSALKALFAQFPAQDGNAEGKLLGYVMALEGQPKWSIDKAVRRFIRGEVAEHDGRFLPSSAELARVAREETDFARKMASNDTRRSFKEYAPRPIPKSDWRRPFPTPEHFRSWKLPAGTLINAAEATVEYPDGTIEGWAAIERRLNDRRTRAA